MSKQHAGDATVALLNQGGGIGAELRSALQVLGASVVYEAPLQALDRAALKASGARVVVINLGDDDDAVDDIQDLIDADDYEIVINDHDVSAQLTGADQTRWARHLAAKILRRPEIILPPRPPGAEALPTFEQHWASRVPAAELIGATVAEPARTSAAIAGAAAVAVIAATPIVEARTVDVASAQASDKAQTVEPSRIELAPIEPDAVIEPKAPIEPEGLEDPGLALALENFDAAADSAPVVEEGIVDLDALLSAARDHESPEQPGPVRKEIAPLPELDSAEAALAAVESATTPAPPTSTKPSAKEFGIEMVPADEYLSPHVEPAPPTNPDAIKEIGAAIPSGFSSLELVPLESDLPAKPKNTVTYDTGRDLQPHTHVPVKPKTEKSDDPEPSKED